MFAPLALGIKQCIVAEMDYENAVVKVKTIADESQKPMEAIGKEMRDISKTSRTISQLKGYKDINILNPLTLLEMEV